MQSFLVSVDGGLLEASLAVGLLLDNTVLLCTYRHKNIVNQNLLLYLYAAFLHLMLVCFYHDLYQIFTVTVIVVLLSGYYSLLQ